MKRIRSGRGLGDNLYLHSVVGHLTARGERLQVCTNYPEIFPFDVTFAPWSRGADITVHYVNGKANPRTTQFEDCCQHAGVPGAAYRAYWPDRQSDFIDGVHERAGGRPMLLINGARWPMDRADGYGRELLPTAQVFNATIDALARHFFTIFIGRGSRLFDVSVDLDLNDWTSPDQVMDLAMACDAGFGQVGFMIPLMEMFDKPLMVMFTEMGLSSRNNWISQLTPQKLFGKNTSTHVVDQWGHQRINLHVDAFCGSIVGIEKAAQQAGGGSR